MKKAICTAGSLAFLSAVFWAVTGMGVWSPIQEGELLRPLVIVFMHCGLMFAGFLVALVEDA